MVLGLAVSWHAYMPAFQSPCHGARVPGLGQVAELLGRSEWVESFLSGSPRPRSVGELCSQGGRWALQQAALRVDSQSPPQQESRGSSMAIPAVCAGLQAKGG